VRRPARPQLTYANVVATIALLTALGGTGYATARIGTAQIRDGAVTNMKLHADAVTGAKVKDGSLRAKDFRAGDLPAGPKGDQGAPGSPGAPGANGSAKAFAMISPALGVNMDAGRTKGFTGESHDASGHWCLTVDPATGIVPATATPVVGLDKGGSVDGAGPYVVLLDKTGAGCTANQFSVLTYKVSAPMTGGAAILTGDSTIGFTLIVP
jgi:hypothetical protein